MSLSINDVRRDPNLRKRGSSAVLRFCGWPALQDFIKQCNSTFTVGLFSILFETGCRVSEVLQLTPEMFKDRGDYVRVEGAPVLKKNHLKSKGKIPDYLRMILEPIQITRLEDYLNEIWEREKKAQRFIPVFRDIPIPKHEKLVPTMMGYVRDRADSYSKDTSLFLNDLTGKPYSRISAYRFIADTNPYWWPHRVRSERATQLRVDYGYDVLDLMKFFNWSSPDMATRYVRLDIGDIEKKMDRK